MNAQEMFEELGFKLMKQRSMSNFEIKYESQEDNTPFSTRIDFHCSKECFVSLLEGGYPIDGGSISPQLLLAINQQMKELGWL